MHQMINIPVRDWKTSMIVPVNIAKGKKKMGNSHDLSCSI